MPLLFLSLTVVDFLHLHLKQQYLPFWYSSKLFISWRHCTNFQPTNEFSVASRLAIKWWINIKCNEHIQCYQRLHAKLKNNIITLIIKTFLISHLSMWQKLIFLFFIMCLAAIIWSGKYQHQKFLFIKNSGQNTITNKKFQYK